MNADSATAVVATVSNAIVPGMHCDDGDSAVGICVSITVFVLSIPACTALWGGVSR